MMKYTVRATTIQKNGQLKQAERTFKSEAARARWIESLKEKGTLYDVLGYSEVV